MYIILIFVGSAAATLFFEFAIMSIAIGAILAPIILFFAWVDDSTGVNHLLIGSWKNLSGVNSPGGIIVQCPDNHKATLWGLLLSLLVLIIALANSLIGLVAIIGIPLGAGMAMTGGVRQLMIGKTDWLRTGLGLLTWGLGAMVVAGLVMRLMHVMSAATC